MARKQISKTLREKVFNKYNGHCAYCGCSLSIKTMQVDHLVSVYRANYTNSKMNVNSIENLMPACRRCNFYKGANSLNDFRESLKGLMNRVKQSFVYRLATQYNMVKEIKWEGKFYFEKQNQK